MRFSIPILVLLFQFITAGVSHSQAIINTETLMKEIDSNIFFSTNAEGDIKSGNINLLQFNSSILAGFKKNNHLVRGFVNYDFLSEEKKTISSDVSGQFRYNLFVKEHSFYTFFQLQNTLSLQLNKRLVSGLGFRQALIKKDSSKNYFDMGYGIFYENEVYQENSNSLLNIENIRISLSTYSQFQLGKKCRIMTVTYLQLNSQNGNDFRIFVEPRFYYDLQKFSFYLKGMYRYHNTPYIDIQNYDSDFLVGFEYKL
ncbi:MAG: DUF481 domain-containing protein [Wenyingzhuangia sp.]|uniref:DUF481 domain-containing protein n=1 Tax=Wenyingzhuangia sp. TaxID=1964193 RepID=UPI003219930E